MTIAGLNESYYEAAQHVFDSYEHIEGGFRRAYPTSTPHLDQISRNFTRYVPELIEQRAGVKSVPWELALESLLQLLQGTRLDWWLVGSAALAARGIEVIPGDIDLSVADSDSQRFGEVLADYLIEPVVPVQDWFCNWFGRAFLHMCIEWVGGVDERADEEYPSDFGPTAWSRRETVSWHGYNLYVPPLDLQLEANRSRGRTERVEAIRQYINK